MFDIYISAFALFFVVIDPIGTAPVFLSVTKHNTVKEKIKTATESVSYCLIDPDFLFINWQLSFLVIWKSSVSRTRNRRGYYFVSCGFRKCYLKNLHLESETKSDDISGRVSIFPLAVPLLAGCRIYYWL